MPKMTLPLLKNKLRQAANAAAGFTLGQKITAAVSQVVIVLFMLFLVVLFKLVFTDLAENDLGAGAVNYVLNQMFFLVFVIAILSSAVSGLYTFFHDREIDYLMSLPLKPSSIFNYLLVQGLILNSWPTIFI